MRIHTNTIEVPGLYSILGETGLWRAGVALEKHERHGSCSRDHAYDVLLSGNSPRNGNFHPEYKAATWDEWGIFLEGVFRFDEDATMAYYKTWDDFRQQTDWRFDTLTVDEQCRLHRWEFTGFARQFECSKCGTVRNPGWAA